MSNYGDDNKRIRTIVFFLIAVIIVALSFDEFQNTPKYSFDYLGKGPRAKTGELVSGVTVSQEIPYDKGCLGISFLFSNSGREISGDVSVRAIGETSGFVYIDEKVSEEIYRNIEYVDLFFPKDLPSEDETIIVTFTSDCESGSAPMLLTTHEDSIPAYSLFFDGEEMQTDLMARKIIHRKTYAVAQVINMLKMVLKLSVAYLLLLGDFWSSPAFIFMLRRFKNFSISAAGIILYALAAALLWIMCVDLGPYAAEVSTVRLGLVFVLTALALRFSLIHRLNDVIRRNRKKILLSLILGILSVAISVSLTQLLKRAGILSGVSRGKTVIIVFCLISLLLFFAGYLFNRISLDIMIATTVFLVGSVYAVSYPVTTQVSWDDHTHYERVLDLSLINKTRLSVADKMVIGHAFEGGATELLKNRKTGEFAREINLLYASEEMVPYSFEKLSVRLILPYLPLMIGLAVSRAFGFPFSFIFILGKCFGVLFYACMMYLAVKQLRSGKLIIAAISLCPLMVFQSSNYTYDTWITALSILAFARFIGIMQDQDRKIRLIDIAVICTLFILGFSSKQVYCPVILSLLFVNNEKLDKKLPAWLYSAVVIFSVVFLAATFMVPFLTSNADGVHMGDMRGGSDVDSGKQLAFIISEPLEYSKILLRSLKHYWSIPSLAAGLSLLGWLGPAGHQLPAFIFLLIIVILDKSREDVYVTNAMRRIWTLLLVFGTSAVVGTSMYLSFTPVKKESINGFQSRYVIPLLFFAAYYLSDWRLVRYVRRFISEKLLFTVSEIIMVAYALNAIYTTCLCRY